RPTSSAMSEGSRLRDPGALAHESALYGRSAAVAAFPPALGARRENARSSAQSAQRLAGEFPRLCGNPLSVRRRTSTQTAPLVRRTGTPPHSTYHTRKQALSLRDRLAAKAVTRGT